MRCHIDVSLHGGRVASITKKDYEGFTSRQMSWATVIKTFRRLSRLDDAAADRIIDLVGRLERIQVRDLIPVLAEAQQHQHAA